jgi:hypothetical protein
VYNLAVIKAGVLEGRSNRGYGGRLAFVGLSRCSAKIEILANARGTIVAMWQRT